MSDVPAERRPVAIIGLSDADVLYMYRTLLVLREMLPVGKSKEQAAAAFTAAVFVYHEILSRQAPATIANWKRQAQAFVDAHPEFGGMPGSNVANA